MNCDVGGKVGEWAELIVIVIAELILQTFCRFTYVTAHSPTLPSLYLRHRSFSNPSVALPTSQLILQPFRCFTYIKTHSPTLPSLYLRHSSFYNPSVASPTSQFILQPFFSFSYVTSSSLNSLGEPPMINAELSSFRLNLSFYLTLEISPALIIFVSEALKTSFLVPCWC